MNKIKLMVFAGTAAAIAAGFILAAQATTALTVSCNGSVSGNQVTWTATSTGGNAPVAFLWSGDSKVAGSVSASVLGTYTTNGTFTAMIQGTDASSTVATSTCQAMVTSNVVPVATSTVNVSLAVNNTAGGLAVPSNFTVTVTGNSPSPSSFPGNASGTAVTVDPSSYTVGASSIANYSASMSGSCMSPIASGTTVSCMITETFVQPSGTSTTPTKFNPPMLNINPGGHFLARGMIVTSVGSGSFQGTVWGITYTVNWNGHLPEFLFRDGKHGTSTSPTAQLNVGDEVGVSGKINTASPFIVNADVVRDYSIISARPNHGNGDNENGNGNGNGNGKGNGQGENNNGSSSSNTQSRLNDLLNQLKNLQNLFKGNGGH